MAVASSSSSSGSFRFSLRGIFANPVFWRGIIALAIAIAFWEVCSRFKQWFGVQVPWIGMVPPPTAVAKSWAGVATELGYWQSWYLSINRVLAGFLAAQVVGIPFGLALAVNRYFRDIFFPPFEILRPIPPLAWVPASLIFWPTNEKIGRAHV